MSTSTYNLSKFLAKILRDRSLEVSTPFNQFVKEHLESPEFQALVTTLESTPNHKQKEVYTSLKDVVEGLSGSPAWQGRPKGTTKPKAEGEAVIVLEVAPEPEPTQEVTITATAVADDEELPQFGPLPNLNAPEIEVPKKPSKRGRKAKAKEVVQAPEAGNEEVTVSVD